MSDNIAAGFVHRGGGQTSNHLRRSIEQREQQHSESESEHYLMVSRHLRIEALRTATFAEVVARSSTPARKQVSHLHEYGVVCVQVHEHALQIRAALVAWATLRTVLVVGDAAVGEAEQLIVGDQLDVPTREAVAV